MYVLLFRQVRNKNVTLLMVLLLVLSSIACESKEQLLAKQKLEDMNTQFTKDEFFKKIKSGDEESVLLFIDAGIDLNSTRSLIYSIACHQKEISKILIKNGADPNVKTLDKVTALMLAAKAGDEDLVRVLIQEGADITARDEYGNDVFAWGNSHPKILKILKEKSAIETK